MLSEKDMAPYIQKYFLERLMKQRNLSPETIKSYRDTFRLYIQYLYGQKLIQHHLICLDCFSAEHILEFLAFLEQERHNSASTINNRLAALHSFLIYLQFEFPQHCNSLQRGLMVPFRRSLKKQMDFLTKEEYQILLNSCDTKNDLGKRDYLMLSLLYNTGMRVSELVGLKASDIITSRDASYIHIFGKGRKERDVPLWKSTTKYLEEYLEHYHIQPERYIFCSYKGQKLTRSGVRYRINCLVAKQSTNIFQKKIISPHTFRHTCALNLLQSGVDISTIAIWLGHESIETTHKYMEADMDMKRQTLLKMKEPAEKAFDYKPDRTVLSFLDSL